MLLEDKDSIFRNIYGHHDSSLKGAISRGAWDGTKFSSTRATTSSSTRVKVSGPPRPRRRGLPDGPQWSFMPKADPRPSYLVINADESEPGSCKDREIMRNDPLS